MTSEAHREQFCAGLTCHVLGSPRLPCYPAVLWRHPNTDGEKADIRAGRIPEGWKDKSAKLAQKDRDARWTVKFSKAKPSDDGSPRIDIAVPSFGYKNHVGIDRRHGLIRTWTATHAARHDGAQLPNLISKVNTASTVWGARHRTGTDIR